MNPLVIGLEVHAVFVSGSVDLVLGETVDLVPEEGIRIGLELFADALLHGAPLVDEVDVSVVSCLDDLFHSLAPAFVET